MTRSADQNLDTLKAERLQLIANGYEITPNADKGCYLKTWPTVEQTEENVDKWTYRMKRYAATGIRLANGLAVIDMDVVDPDVFEAVAVAFEDILADAGVDVSAFPIRGTDISCKEAWFVRTEEPFGRIHTYRWRAPGAGPDDPTGHVEIFGGASARQFGAFGPHDLDKGSSYVWRDGVSPLNVPLADLPLIGKAVLFKLADAADGVLQRAGWEQVKRSQNGEDRAERVYDLEPDMSFDCSDGVTRTLDELRLTVADVGTLRCSASFLEGPEARRRDRCLVRTDKSGGLAIWETSAGVTHCEAACAPRPGANELDLEEVRAKLKDLSRAARRQVRAEDEFNTVVAKLLEKYAFCPTQVKNVVPIDAQTVEDGMTLGNFRTAYLPWHTVEVGPRGGETKINPADVWASRRDRVNVSGIRCDPNEDFPTFRSDGETWLNLYRPPAWPEAGGVDAGPWLEYLAHLVPDPDERAWFSQWLAYKVRNPGIPGPCVVMVGRVQGTGRGTLFDLLEEFFGARFVLQLAYEMFAGKTYQSQYNEWRAGAVLVCVNESDEVTDGTAYQTKHNAYETIKEVADPRSRRIQVVVKGRSNYWTRTSASFLVATNHKNALPLAEDDRRIYVVTNGGRLSAGMAERLHAWRSTPGAMGALQSWLWSVDLTGYSPYADPPMTRGKREMIDSHRTDLDDAVADAVAALKSPVFVIRQLESYITDTYGHDDLPNNWRAGLKRIVQARYTRVGSRAAGNWRLKMGRRPYVVYAVSEGAAVEFEHDLERVKAAVMKNGDPATAGDTARKLGTHLKLITQ